MVSQPRDSTEDKGVNRLSNCDRNFGPVTLGKWSRVFSACIQSGDDEDRESCVIVAGFGWALRLRVWDWLCRPWRERWVECNWDEETVKRLGRNGYWSIHERRFGVSLSDMGAGYDFLQIFYGPYTHDSSTTKIWCKHLPWKMWRHVRHSLYTPEGEHFHTEKKGDDFREWFDIKERCPKVHFWFEDYDGELIAATCNIEEREWHRGEGWFKWLRFFYPAKIVRSLDLQFSAEVGPRKGSWKGGTIGHGIDMLPGESAEAAFRRYCEKDHERNGRKYNLRFIGKCKAPPPKPKASYPTADAAELKK